MQVQLPLAVVGQVVGAEPDVLQDRTGAGHQDLLEHGDDAEFLGALGIARLGVGAADLDPARVRRVHPAQDLHQRALARAVLAGQDVDLARAQLERAVPERLGRPERLRHVLHADQDLGRGRRARHVDDHGILARRHRNGSGDGSPAIYEGVRPRRGSARGAPAEAVSPEPTMPKNLQGNRLIPDETYMKR